MTFAVNTGVIEHNKLAGIGKAFATAQVTNQASLKPEQLPELMNALNYASIKLITRCLIEWQLHTMTRPSEAAGARWDEIDREKLLWSIPAERMKKGRPHTIPFTTQTLALLDTIKSITADSEYVFPSDKTSKKHINKETANTALKRMGFKGRQTSHGLRALASTTLNEQGFDVDVIEAALSHVDKDKVLSSLEHDKEEFVLLDTSDWESSANTVIKDIEFSSELNGSLKIFGESFWRKILTEDVNVVELLNSNVLTEIHYTDRYLQSPTSLLLISQLIGSFCNAADVKPEIKVETLFNVKERAGHLLHHDWQNHDDFKEVFPLWLKTKAKTDVELIVHKYRSDIAHRRKLTFKFESGKELTFRFDQGVGYWRLSDPTTTNSTVKYNFNNDEFIQFSALKKLEDTLLVKNSEAWTTDVSYRLQ